MREPTSTTWKNVLQDVNQHLMTISFGILADVLLSVRSLIRGIALLSEVLTRRAARPKDDGLAASLAFDSTGKPVLYLSVHVRPAKHLGHSLEGELEEEEDCDAGS